MEQPFKIRSYGYGELALLYFLNSTKKSASTQLGRWIKTNEDLKIKLMKSGYKPGKRIFTPKQVKILVTILGEP